MSLSWKRVISGIAIRISLSIAIVVALTTVTVAWLILQEERHVLELELQKKGTYLARVIAQQIIEPLLYEERYVIYNIILSSLNAEEGIVVFGVVYDSEGNPVVNLGKGEFQIPVVDKKNLLALRDTMLRENNDLQLYEIVVPIVAKGLGPVGYLRLGITKRFMIETVTGVKKQLYILSSIIVISGIMAGLWMARKIIRPVLVLNQGVQRVGRGELGAVIDVVGHGEIKELSLAFNEMSAKLKESVDAIKTAQENLVRTEKLYALGEFSAGLAHEIKNPLTSIKMLMQAAIESDAPLCSTDMSIIEREINRIDRIVNEFLEFGRPAKTDFVMADINKIIKEVIILSRPKIEQADINIEEYYDYNIPMVKAQVDGLKQVFMNIVLNAIQATNQGGTITVSTSSDNNTVAACIRDTGCGIPPENISRVFDPFFTTKEDGTGMGLAIAYSIVREHRGRIEIDSAINKGTVVSVLLLQDCCAEGL